MTGASSWVGSRPALGSADAGHHLEARWGIRASMEPLPSERDQNFLARPLDGAPPVVLKIANLAEDPAFLDCQEQAMRRLHAAGLPVAPPVPARDGRTIVDLGVPGPPWARVLPWLEGTPMVAISESGDALLGDLGATMGRAATALLDLRHAAAARPFQWDVLRAPGVIADGLPAVAEPDRQALLARALAGIDARLVPLFATLRTSIIHNDANDHNVLVDEAARRVVGLLDFGDMCHSVTAHEAAVAATYAMFHRADPGSVLPPLIRGFDAACPLLDAELDALPDLVLARVAASLAISARQGVMDPDPYLRISEAPGWALLGWLDATGAEALRATVHAAVGR